MVRCQDGLFLKFDEVFLRCPNCKKSIIPVECSIVKGEYLLVHNDPLCPLRSDIRAYSAKECEDIFKRIYNRG